MTDWSREKLRRHLNQSMVRLYSLSCLRTIIAASLCVTFAECPMSPEDMKRNGIKQIRSVSPTF